MMRVLNDNETLPSGESSVLTVGNFDGMHRGHRHLLGETVRRASQTGAKSAVVTFDPPTRFVTGGSRGGQQLTTLEEKAVLIGMAGIDYLACLTFDDRLRRMTPEAFIKEILVRRLRMAGLVLGRGHAFGLERAGNEIFLHATKGKYHFTTFVSDLLSQEGDTISSTQIRECVIRGDIRGAVIRLGHPYLVSVERTGGKKLGTELGYPTLNFRSPPSRKVIPPPGVYAAELEYRGRWEEGALYFGECPTLKEHRECHFEFHSFGRGSEDIGEGRRAHLWLYSFIRADSAFAGTGELVRQMGRDIETIRNFFMKEKVPWR